MAEPARGAPPPTRLERGTSLALHLVGFALLAHLGYGVLRHAMDLDEFQFLYGGWRIAQGSRPYLDFWDDHGPLLSWLCSLFYRAGGTGDAAALFVHRAALFLLLLATAALVHRIARRVRPGDAGFAGLALALFAASPVLGHRGIEVRSDSLQQPLWALSLLLWLRAAETGAARSFCAAGVAAGACFLVTPKAAMLGVAAGGMFAVRMAYRRRLEPRALAAYALGALAGPAALALWQWSAGAWDAWLAAYVGDSLLRARFPLAQGFASLASEAPLASALALGAALVAALRGLQGRLPEPAACLFVCGGALVLQYLFLLPVHFSQSLIPAAAPVAVASAWALAELLPRSRAPRAAALGRVALVAAVCAVAAFEASARRYGGGVLESQLERGARVASLVPPGALLFDGGQLPIERLRPLPVLALVIHVQQQILAGRFPQGVAEALDRQDVAFWRVDGRTRALDPLLRANREASFLPLDGDLWVAGQRLIPDASGAADFEVRAAGAYWWESGGGAALRIDGREVASPVRLGDGRHRAEWPGGGPLLLAAVPPEQWTASLRAAPR